MNNFCRERPSWRSVQKAQQLRKDDVMKLVDLLKDLEIQEMKGNPNIDINSVKTNSNDVQNNDLFICIKGFKTDGHRFIDEVVKKGATCIIVQDIVNIEGVTTIRVADTRIAMAVIASNYYDNPSAKVKLVGVTGTKGKTTTTFMIKKILENQGHKVGLIGTVANMIGDKIKESHRTTPDVVELQQLLNEMVEEGVDTVVMEVSSHSLELHRVYGCNFEIGAFTNLTQDHLDFHETFENYFLAKSKLFKLCKTGFVNIDDSYGKRLLDLEGMECSFKTYAINGDADLKACDIVVNNQDVKFSLLKENKKEDILVNIPGRFTVYNALAATSVCLELGCSIENIKQGLAQVVVPGRSEILETNDDFTIMIDYAHSPDSLESIIKAVSGYAKGRVVSVFGCGGDRDKTKRPIMGRISVTNADFTIITSDNPRTENPEAIIADIEQGIKDLDCEYIVITDRKKAIEYAIRNAKKDDFIILAGKGHETYQVLGTKEIHFDEREIVREILLKL